MVRALLILSVIKGVIDGTLVALSSPTHSPRRKPAALPPSKVACRNYHFSGVLCRSHVDILRSRLPNDEVAQESRFQDDEAAQDKLSIHCPGRDVDSNPLNLEPLHFVVCQDLALWSKSSTPTRLKTHKIPKRSRTVSRNRGQNPPINATLGLSVPQD
jgi:hypothetical protein